MAFGEVGEDFLLARREVVRVRQLGAAVGCASRVRRMYDESTMTNAYSVVVTVTATWTRSSSSTLAKLWPANEAAQNSSTAVENTRSAENSPAFAMAHSVASVRMAASAYSA